MNKSACFALLFLTTGVASAQTLYGLSSEGFQRPPVSGKLWSVDEATGAATYIADLKLADGETVATSIVGMANLNGTLYATDCFNSTNELFGSIDPATGIFTPISQQDAGASLNWFCLAADPDANALYTVEYQGSDAYQKHLLAVDPSTGNLTDHGLLSRDIYELAWDTANSTLYGVGDDGVVYKVDKDTADLTSLGGQISLTNSNSADLTYDPSSGKLFFNDGGGHNLYQVDTATGVFTLIGSNGVQNNIDGLAPAVVPEPVSLLSFGLGGIALAVRKRRRA
ncbi:MAG TPA: PEP-CTERM sorting domain-containing protein [Fimbriimonadaceae bacterium]|nr:PEP-CTERM sorting domain-containing protein [Fimbriimonadaceae bacterium]